MKSIVENEQELIIENKLLRLIVGKDCLATSLVHKATGEECLYPGQEIALFSVTQERPFNNEVKLAHPNKRTVFQGNSLQLSGNNLIIGFAITPFKALVELTIKPLYIAFSLIDFLVQPEDYAGLRMTPPPVAELRLVQLPIRQRTNFGEWLNVSWNEKLAVNLLATSPYARIDSEQRKGYRLMSADAVQGVRLQGTGAALIVSSPDQLLDVLAVIEKDFALPQGVASRRSDLINASALWTARINPGNVDEHIKYAKKGGFRCLMIKYSAIFKEKDGVWYWYLGDYDYRDQYPRGRADLKEMLDKIKAAGLVPGFHFLHTHIGLESRYISPRADHRLNLTRTFTLARSLSADDTTVYVEQNPAGSVMDEPCRVLSFAGELISYTSYTTEPPYYFSGCQRGVHATKIKQHPQGEIGGVLAVSEHGASSVYLDQDSSLSAEISEKLADIYNAGFQFAYFDGSEGTGSPYDFHVPHAQYRLYRKMKPAPLFAEGAAKAHFSWHFLSGGNAFDIFPAAVFKERIRQFPAEQAPRMQQDFTRLNFGWWAFWQPDTQPDMYEYGTSRAAAWDCPVTVMENLEGFRKHPRTKDIFEVLRRWEDVRQKRLLTAQQKLELQDLDQEHILLINEKKEYELVPYDRIENAAGGHEDLLAFAFSRKSRNYIVFWHRTASGSLELNLAAKDITLERDPGGDLLPYTRREDKLIIPVADRCYLSSKLPREILLNAFSQARLC